LLTVAAALRGKVAPPEVSLAIAPGSKQVLQMLASDGSLADIIAAGARILESACGPCIGMGQSPMTGAVSIRSFNRNFEGRSGTKSASVYLASPETCVACALTGEITDPRTLGAAPSITMPERFTVDDGMIVAPAEDPDSVEVLRGPNIQFVEPRGALQDTIRFRVLLRLGDNITTDDIAPAGAKILPYRSNIPKMAEFCFASLAPDFAEKARDAGSGAIVGGENYGQGSSREHAALAPMYLGVQAVLARSFARIHQANLVNFGILPLIIDAATYESLQDGDEVEFTGVLGALEEGNPIRAANLTRNTEFAATAQLTPMQVEVVKAGGTLTYVRNRAGAG
jgi:aconitate hydratase